MLRTTGYNEDMVAVYSDDDYINRLDIMALDTINGENIFMLDGIKAKIVECCMKITMQSLLK